ncbi:hypothetical protein [Leptolyngbya sp. KIOST-1]|uniref:hypothetical protein n=1 Tax=Leptolyngbya sp. KIOST-1 TaxID=1229172 RepID=UPI00068B8F31|nr:hypothetical protein [Leptolyngbya sp. KIOST-1]
MIAVAVSLNVVIALFCFYVAWRLWRLSKTLGAVADALVNWERNTHNVLDPVVIPPAILRGQSGTAYLRQNYSLLQFQIQRLEQVMGIVGLFPMANRWLRARGRRPGPKMNTMTLSRRR